MTRLERLELVATPPATAVERLRLELLRQRLQLSTDEVSGLLRRLHRLVARHPGIEAGSVVISVDFSGREFDLVVEFTPSVAR